MRRRAQDAGLRLVPDDPASRVERARRGDRPAISEIYAELSPRVNGYLRGGGARDHEKLTGDVFLSVVQGLSTFDGDEAGLRRWVFTIAHDRLIDARRRATVRAIAPPIVGCDDSAAGETHDGVLDEPAVAPAVRALAQLAPEQRDVVLLRSIAGLSIADTAAYLGENAGIHEDGPSPRPRRPGAVVERETVS